MCLTSISSFLGDTFRLLYSRIHQFFIRKIKKNQTHKKTKNSCNKKLLNQSEKYEINDLNLNENITMNSDYHKQKSQKEVRNENSQFEIKDKNDEKVTVPLTITLLIITAYLFIGSFMFNQFEEWTLIQAAYFCFISLSTIGKKKIFNFFLKIIF